MLHADRLYRLRRPLIALACAAPVLLLALVWWLVTDVILVPSIPQATTPPEQVVEFITHPKGLPWLAQARAETFLYEQVRRLLSDASFRDRFLSALRTASPDEQAAFRAHLFDAFKPIFMRDVHRFHELTGEQRRAYLDERIVAYNRMAAYAGRVEIRPDAIHGLAPSQSQLLELLTQRTTEQERQLAAAYQAALQARVLEILADPELKADFEARIAGTR